MTMPSVDVVIPNYNYGRYLRACAESVLSQDIEELRLLIVDNASTDESITVARELAASDRRVELLLRTANAGPHASFNDGIEWAKADYFLILFADDFLVPRALRRAVSVLERNPSVAFTYGRDVPIQGDEAVPAIATQSLEVPYRLESGHAFIERFCRLGVFQLPGASLIVRTSAQKMAGHYLEALPHSDDYHLWLRLALQGDVVEFDCIQAGIRSHDSNRSKELCPREAVHIQHTAAASEYFFAHEARVLPDCKRLCRLARRGIAERAYWSAVSHALRGAHGALELFRLAFSMRPITAIAPPVSYLFRRPDAQRRIRSLLGGAISGRLVSARFRMRLGRSLGSGQAQ